MEKETVFRKIPIEKIKIDEGELRRRLGGDDEEAKRRLGEIKDELLSRTDARFSATILPTKAEGDTVAVGDVKINSEALAKHLKGARRSAVIAITLGVELDRYIRRLTAASVSLGFIADAYASALADGACSAAVSELLGDTPHTAPFAIGYADTDLSLLPRLAETTDAGRLIGISFSSSNLIIPTKSIIVIVGKM